jgi:hypothetical protein
MPSLSPPPPAATRTIRTCSRARSSSPPTSDPSPPHPSRGRFSPVERPVQTRREAGSDPSRGRRDSEAATR